MIYKCTKCENPCVVISQKDDMPEYCPFSETDYAGEQFAWFDKLSKIINEKEAIR